MSRSVPLFDPSGRPTTFMVRQWGQKGGAQPIRLLPYLSRDGTATPQFQALWTQAFPTRDALPSSPIVDSAGRASDEFWRIFS